MAVRDLGSARSRALCFSVRCSMASRPRASILSGMLIVLSIKKYRVVYHSNPFMNRSCISQYERRERGKIAGVISHAPYAHTVRDILPVFLVWYFVLYQEWIDLNLLW